MIWLALLVFFFIDILILIFILVAELWTWSHRILVKSKIKKETAVQIYDQKQLAEYMNQFFAQKFQGVNYLMIAHAGALLSTLSILKEYVSATKDQRSPTTLDAQSMNLIKLDGFGPTISEFAFGLMFAILGYIMLSVTRDNIMSTILLNQRKTIYSSSFYLTWCFCAVSTFLLFNGILSIANHLSGF